MTLAKNRIYVIRMVRILTVVGWNKSSKICSMNVMIMSGMEFYI